MAETVESVVSGRSGDQSFGRELHPTGKRCESVEHRSRINSNEVSEEDSVETYSIGENGCGERTDETRRVEQLRNGQSAQIEMRKEGKFSENSPTERPAPVARFAIEVILVSWGW